MSGIDPTTRPLADLWTRLTTGAPPKPATPAAKPTLADRDDAYASALDKLPAATLAAPVTLNATNDAPTTASRLDAYKASWGGPYTVEGQTVTAPAQFRMGNGVNGAGAFGTTPDGKAIQGRLDGIAAKAGLAGQVEDLRYGRGTPEALVKVTQALIDAGELPKVRDALVARSQPQGGSSPTTAECVQALQWKFGIGVDCAGYVYGALAASHGDPTKLGLKSRGDEDLRGLASNPNFAKVDPTVARPGDVIVLAGKGVPSDPGHNLVVYSHTVLRADAKDDLAKLCNGNEKATAFMKAARGIDGRPDAIDRYEVDSSFGSGADGLAHGGARRDVLVRNERTGQWLSIKSTTPPELSVGNVPCGETALTGIFRAAVAR